MTTGSILVAIALFILVSVFVLRPILTERFRPIKTEQDTALIRQKDQKISDIKAIEFDFETGKVPESSFHADREKLVIEAAELLQRIDNLPDPDAEIEMAIQSTKEKQKSTI